MQKKKPFFRTKPCSRSKWRTRDPSSFWDRWRIASTTISFPNSRKNSAAAFRVSADFACSFFYCFILNFERSFSWLHFSLNRTLGNDFNVEDRMIANESTDGFFCRVSITWLHCKRRQENRENCTYSADQVISLKNCLRWHNRVYKQRNRPAHCSLCLLSVERKLLTWNVEWNEWS